MAKIGIIGIGNMGSGHVKTINSGQVPRIWKKRHNLYRCKQGEV